MSLAILPYSIATVDFDYSKAFGGGQEASVSSAGGTLGSGTRAAPGRFSSFASSILSPGQQQQPRDETLVIFAPAGKLGVVIDTPDSGYPVVYNVKSQSVLIGQLRVGDKLVSIDDEDVTGLSAVMISKIISRKSNNPTRKLTVLRSMG